MSTPAPLPPQESSSTDDMRVFYWLLGAIVVVMCVIGLVTYSGKKETEAAQQKAQELATAFGQAGLPVPTNLDIIVRSLGDDGGNVCENPASALGRAVLYDQITNGADFVGRRPVIIDKRVIQGGALILQTYCPDKLKEFQDKFDDLKFDDTIEE